MSILNALWFHGTHLSDKEKQVLVAQLKTSNAIYEASKIDYKKCGLGEDSIDRLLKCKGARDGYEKVIEYCNTQDISIVSWEDGVYPTMLKEIQDLPHLLFIKGNKSILQQHMIAIVGSRKCSEYGYEVAKKIGEDLAKRGVVVVSGMAMGIDEAAHKGALEKGKTVAVLGTGVDVCYPSRNRKLYQSIQEQGCVVSEFMPGDQGLPYHFPRRNRIISGLSLGTLVVEAANKSGSLITAHLALEQNREVFAIPGNVFSLFSQGTNKLIQAGAKLVMSAEDILNEFPNHFEEGNLDLENNQSIILDKVEIMVYDCLSWQPNQIENIYGEVKQSQSFLTMQTLEMILFKLEMKGLVQRLPARRYSRKK